MIEDKIYSYFDRNPGLHVLFFFDPSGMKEEELAAVQWREGFRFLAPRGSWFRIKYLIDRDWANDKVILYIAQLSPAKLKQEFPLMTMKMPTLARWAIYWALLFIIAFYGAKADIQYIYFQF